MLREVERSSGRLRDLLKQLHVAYDSYKEFLWASYCSYYFDMLLVARRSRDGWAGYKRSHRLRAVLTTSSERVKSSKGVLSPHQRK